MDEELKVIVKHFVDLYAEEIENGEITGDIIHEWWSLTKDQYNIEIFDVVEKAIYKAIY